MADIVAAVGVLEQAIINDTGFTSEREREREGGRERERSEGVVCVCLQVLRYEPYPRMPPRQRVLQE